jgi:thiol-disulfide isomerase/thioredoxin
MALFKKLFLAVAIIILLVFLGFYLKTAFIAPNVTFTTIAGQKINMVDLKGKVVLVNFWATDCRSCIKEMPELVTIYNAYKEKGFEVISVAMPYDPPAQVFNYVTQKVLPFPVMHDGFAEITEAFGGVSVTPTAFIYDKQGKRLQKTVGTLNFKDLSLLLTQELAK